MASEWSAKLQRCLKIMEKIDELQRSEMTEEELTLTFHEESFEWHLKRLGILCPELMVFRSIDDEKVVEFDPDNNYSVNHLEMSLTNDDVRSSMNERQLQKIIDIRAWIHNSCRVEMGMDELSREIVLHTEIFADEKADFLKQISEILVLCPKWIEEKYLDNNRIFRFDENNFSEEQGLLKNAIAGKLAEVQNTTSRAIVGTTIRKVQNKIVELSSDERKGPLPVEELIKLCLEGKIAELLLLAFDLFVWSSSSIRRTHAHSLHICWKESIDQDDWIKLYQASISERWNDEETLQILKDTVLFKASKKCYGPKQELPDGLIEEFSEVLQLRKPVNSDSVSSVEAILEQHKDYPVAGMLMLKAIILGSSYDGEKEGPTAMEWKV